MANSGRILERGTDGITVEAATPASQPGDVFPSGVVMPYAGSSAPTNWQICDGTAVSRATFAALFAVIGTTYGAGDGSTTFNLPDLRGKSIVGKHTSGTFTTLGQTGGEENHTLSVNELPSHNHGGATNANTVDHTHTVSHDHALTMGNGGSGFGVGSYPATEVNGPALADYGGGGTGAPIKVSNPTSSGANVTHNHVIPSQGGGAVHNNMHPYMVLHHIIKN